MHRSMEQEILDYRNQIIYYEQNKKTYENDLGNVQDLEFENDDDFYTIMIKDRFNSQIYDIEYSRDGNMLVFNGDNFISYLDMSFDDQKLLEGNNTEKLYINGGRQVLVINKLSKEQFIFDVVKDKTNNISRSLVGNTLSIMHNQKKNQKKQKIIMKCGDHPMKVKFTNQDKYLLIYDTFSKINVYDFVQETIIKEINIDTRYEEMKFAAFSQNGHLMSKYMKNQFMILNIKEQFEKLIVIDESLSIKQLQITVCNKRVLCGINNNQVSLYEIESSSLLKCIEIGKGKINELVISRDGRKAALNRGDNQVHIFDLVKMRQLDEILIDSKQENRFLRFTQNSQSLIYGGFGDITLYDLKSKTEQFFNIKGDHFEPFPQNKIISYDQKKVTIQELKKKQQSSIRFGDVYHVIFMTMNQSMDVIAYFKENDRLYIQKVQDHQIISEYSLDKLNIDRIDNIQFYRNRQNIDFLILAIFQNQVKFVIIDYRQKYDPFVSLIVTGFNPRIFCISQFLDYGRQVLLAKRKLDQLVIFDFETEKSKVVHMNVKNIDGESYTIDPQYYTDNVQLMKMSSNQAMLAIKSKNNQVTIFHKILNERGSYEINDIFLQYDIEDVSNILCIEFSPCSKQIAVGADDEIVRILNIETQTIKKIKTYNNQQTINNVQFLYNGQKVFIYGEYNAIEFHDVYEDYGIFNEILKFAQAKDQEALEEIKLTKYLLVNIRKSIDYGISFIYFLFFLNDNMITQNMLNYLIENKIYIHFSLSHQLRNYETDFIYDIILDKMDRSTQKALFEYIVFFQKRNDCGFCSKEVYFLVKYLIRNQYECHNLLDSLLMNMDIFISDPFVNQKKQYIFQIDNYSKNQVHSLREKLTQKLVKKYKKKKVIGENVKYKKVFFYILKMKYQPDLVKENQINYIKGDLLQTIGNYCDINNPIYESTALNLILSRQWEKQGRRYYLKLGVYFMIFCIIQCIQILEFTNLSQQSKDQKQIIEVIFQIILNVCTTCIVGYYLKLEYQQYMISKVNMIEYSRDIWNIMESTSFILLIITNFLSIFQVSGLIDGNAVIGIIKFGGLISLCLNWIILTKYLRVYEGFQNLLIIIWDCVYNLRYFAFFLAITVLNIFYIFYILQSNGFRKNEQPYSFEKFTIFKWSYLLLLSDFSDFMKQYSMGIEIDNDHNNMPDPFVFNFQSFVMFLVFMGVTTFLNIAMMNLIISVILDQYNKSLLNLKRIKNYQKLQMMIELNNRIYYNQNYNKFVNYLIFTSQFNQERFSNEQPTYKEKIIQSVNEIAGQLKNMQFELKQKLIDCYDNLNDKVHNMEQQLEEMEANQKDFYETMLSRQNQKENKKQSQFKEEKQKKRVEFSTQDDTQKQDRPMIPENKVKVSRDFESIEDLDD